MRHGGPPTPARHRAPPPEERSLTAFLGSFPRADVALEPPHPEIAFLGRSNVGKSSLLNALAGRRLARVSRTPGKTRLLNVYRVDPGSGEWGVVASGTRKAPDTAPLPTPHSCYLLDLPGYGYARAAKADRAAFRRLLTHTLARPSLAGVVWLLDIRHPPSRDDLAMHALLARTARAVLAALTKSDKLSRAQRLARRRALQDTLALDEDQMLVTSARTGEGIADLRQAIAALVTGPPAAS